MARESSAELCSVVVFKTKHRQVFVRVVGRISVDVMDLHGKASAVADAAGVVLGEQDVISYVSRYIRSLGCHSSDGTEGQTRPSTAEAWPVPILVSVGSLAVDWLDFVASVIRSLAWPLAAVTLGWMFRRELRGLFGRLLTARKGDYEFTFAPEIEDLRERVVRKVREETVGEEKPEVRVARTSLAAFGLRNFENTRDVVLGSWTVIDDALRNLGRTSGAANLVDGMPEAGWPRELLSHLESEGVLHPDEVALVQEAKDLRQRIAKGAYVPGISEALKYAATADLLAGLLRRRADS